ncbi:MAG: CaiB/BaiF CoA transferase family protein, partial [Anaerolineales bacterium]
MNEKSQGLLSGIRVLDLSRVLAGPFCTMMLGDLGADVIKVEAPGRGDDTRSWGPPFAPGGEAAYFLAANRNKRSLTLNLKAEAGLEVLRDLIRWADVLVENFRTGTLAEWGLDPEALEQLHPGLIYCTITGYGTTGPDRDRPGYDFIVQAEGGFMSVTGPADGEPFRAGVAIADLAAGMFAACAILGAIAGRKPGEPGERIDISLLDSQLALLSYVASNYLISGQAPRRYGNAHPNIVPYQSFRAQDAHFAFAAGNDLQWRRFCHGVGKDEWAKDPRFATNAARLANREELVAALRDLFATRPAAEWLA